MFLKKSSAMFRRTSIISVALYARKLCCKINNFKLRAKASRKPLKKSFENIFYKVTGRTKNRKQKTDEKDIQENSRIRSVKSKFSGISVRNLFSKITLGKLTSSSCQQAKIIQSDSGISETLSTNGVLPTQASLLPVLLDKDFQCTSTTALYLSELGEKGEITTLEYHLFEKGYNNSDVEKEFNEFTIDNVSEDYASKFKIPVGSRERLHENTSSKQLAEVDLIDKDFQCTSATARYLSDLVEIDPTIIAMHGLYDDSLYNYDIDELKILYSFNNRMLSSESIIF